MSQRSSSLDPSERSDSSRRRFLARLGTTGLATSALVFGRTDPAHASCTRACCVLYVCPNTSFSACRSGPDYTWYCQYTSTRGCSCCEGGGLGANWDGTSAYKCDRV